MARVRPAPPGVLDSRRRFIAYAGAAAALGAALGLGLHWWRTAGPGKSVEERFWQHQFTMLDGSRLAAASFRGRPLLLNFWAPWCPPCVEEMPLLDVFFSQNRQNGHQILGIALDRDEAVRSFLIRVPVRFPIAVAGMAGAELARELGNLSGGLPYTVFFAANGQIARRKMGRIVEEDLRVWGQPQT